VVAAFRAFVPNTNAARSNDLWSPWALEDENVWSTIERGRALQTFMATADHVKAIEDYLLELLDDVQRFKDAHPELPWGDASTEQDTDDP
jgi:hypothetical protein